jgi:hypothetical protein
MCDSSLDSAYMDWMVGKYKCDVWTNDGPTHSAVAPGSDPQTGAPTLIEVADNVEVVRWIEFPNSVPQLGQEASVFT